MTTAIISAANAIDLSRSVDDIDMLRISENTDKKWYVLHTKSRREKKLASICEQLCIRHYLPFRKSITGSRGRRHITDVPLFQGYLFSCVNGQERWRLLQTGHIANTIDVVDQEGLISDLRNIRNACERCDSLEPSLMVKRGHRVRIMDGPMVGLEGVVRRHRGRYRLVLSMDCIQQAVACEVDVRMVAPI